MIKRGNNKNILIAMELEMCMRHAYICMTYEKMHGVTS
jgi:hypothetical protein